MDSVNTKAILTDIGVIFLPFAYANVGVALATKNKNQIVFYD